jgi:hypothetical protein
MESAQSGPGKRSAHPFWFTLLLNGAHAAIADKHVPMYVSKGLLQRADTLADVASAIGVDFSTLSASLLQYEADAAAGYVLLTDFRFLLSSCHRRRPLRACFTSHWCCWRPPCSLCDFLLSSADGFGKKMFPNAGFSQGPFFFGIVTPTLHYCMGGLHIDNDAHVLAAPISPGSHLVPIPGLFAAGEVVGGIHGNNRLAGNALTECVVFGRIAARSIFAEAGRLLTKPADQEAQQVAQPSAPAALSESKAPLPVVTSAQLREKDGKAGRPLWSAIHGSVASSPARLFLALVLLSFCALVSCAVPFAGGCRLPQPPPPSPDQIRVRLH